jgi:hypothetical protein
MMTVPTSAVSAKDTAVEVFDLCHSLEAEGNAISGLDSSSMSASRSGSVQAARRTVHWMHFNRSRMCWVAWHPHGPVLALQGCSSLARRLSWRRRSTVCQCAPQCFNAVGHLNGHVSGGVVP